MDILISSTSLLYAEGTQYAWTQCVTQYKLAPDEGVCTQVLHTSARHGLPELAIDVLRRMKLSSIPHQEQHIAALLDSFIAADKLKEALAIIALLRTDTAQPTFETTHTLFLAISKDIDTVDRAFAHLEELHRSGEGKVDVAAYNAVIAAAVHLGDLGRAVGIFKEASDFGVSPNTETLNTLLTGCIKFAHRPLADSVVAELKAKGVEPNEGTYERLIILCLTQATYEDAFFYLEEMKGARYKPTYKVYDAIVRRCLTSGDGRWKLASEEMEAAGYEKNTLLERFIKNGGKEDEE